MNLFYITIKKFQDLEFDSKMWEIMLAYSGIRKPSSNILGALTQRRDDSNFY